MDYTSGMLSFFPSQEESLKIYFTTCKFAINTTPEYNINNDLKIPYSVHIVNEKKGRCDFERY
jgi:hypothetical protein